MSVFAVIASAFAVIVAAHLTELLCEHKLEKTRLALLLSTYCKLWLLGAHLAIRRILSIRHMLPSWYTASFIKCMCIK